MDYQKELFVQSTPYLQWLAQRAWIKDCESEATGEPICVFPFSSCTDSVKTVLSESSVDRECIYLFINAGGVLCEGAKTLIKQAFDTHKKALVIYSDEDYYGTLEELYEIEAHGLFRCEPWFKPDFSPDTLESFFYIGNVFAIKGAAIADMIDAYGMEIPLCELVRKIARKTAAADDCAHGREIFVHLPEVLYTNNRLSEKDVLHCFAQDIFEKSSAARIGGMRAKLGRLSVIIPSKDNPQVLKQCIETFVQCATGMDYELIVVDNGSADENRVRIAAFLEECDAAYLYEKAQFNFSQMCNRGARAADGDFLLFLNDDIEVGKMQRDGRWLVKMMRYAATDHIGAVGIKLRYPDGSLIQHAGITNMGIGPAHKLGGMADEGNLYHGHNLADYNMLAVTAACMLVSREKFERAGGFDEEFAVAYNDVELCFRLYRMGWYNVVVNSDYLLHHESLSRGEDTAPEKKARLLCEKQKLYEKHPWASPKAQAFDPFYSPNLVQWENDAAYHVNYQYPYDKIVELKRIFDHSDQNSDKKTMRLLRREEMLRKLEETNVRVAWLCRKLTGADRHLLHIDGVTLEEGIVTITGWHVLRKQDNANLEKRLWIYNGQSVYEAILFPKLRRDVEALFVQEADCTKNTALSGICLKFSASQLPKGTYRIGIVVRKRGRIYLACVEEQLNL